MYRDRGEFRWGESGCPRTCSPPVSWEDFTGLPAGAVQRLQGPRVIEQRNTCFYAYKYFNSSSTRGPLFQSQISFTWLLDYTISPAVSSFLHSAQGWH